MDNAKVIKQQLYDFKLGAIKRIKEERLEGEIMKRQAKENYEEQKKAEAERRKKQLE
eukprot:CAMPEP_0202963324 /NCGR_PEP_ID=MMETSP1396-20130829/7307_1 /ASSEMBLY_ACC=CAM_ASM_000872 /TAXON_ID= /ORGANISM="Pseudokeronopsis sp., Strain Brazil" /LENGTH=56 /DNA_ID=CAMNT_0049684427 /DNA_START=592 /DNA_END=762 /DNA_ORIENTATION=+